MDLLCACVDGCSTAPAPAAVAAASKPKKKSKKSKSPDELAAPHMLADVELMSPSLQLSSPPPVSAASSPPIRPPSPPSRIGATGADDEHDFSAIAVMPSPTPASTAAASTNLPARPSFSIHPESKEQSEASSSSATGFASNLAIAAPPAESFERHIDFSDGLSHPSSSSSNPAAAGGAPLPVAEEFPSNLVRTSKYTFWNFLPRNLFEQFTEPANMYFLFVGILQAIPAISTTAGIPTHYLPLSFILIVSATRAAYEDYNRHQSDELEGKKKYLVYDRFMRAFVTKTSADIVVGDVVQMVFGNAQDELEEEEDALQQQQQTAGESPVSETRGGSGGVLAFPRSYGDAAAAPASRPPLDLAAMNRSTRSGRDRSVTYSSSFPADMLFLSSSHEKGHCFVETASLDGETSLKIRAALPGLHQMLYVAPSHEGAPAPSQVDGLRGLDFALDVEAPNAKFDSFKGLLHLNPHGNMGPSVPQQKIMLKAENLLLRGTELRNTPFVLGLVVYTGPDSKIRRNVQSSNSRSKRSSLMLKVNSLLIGMLTLQMALCFLGALLCLSWTSRNFHDAWYLLFTESAALAALRSFFTWFIILAQMVPISLLVSNELVKAAQAQFIAWDVTMYDPTTNQPTIVRNSQLHEDLGQVEQQHIDTSVQASMAAGCCGSSCFLCFSRLSVSSGRIHFQ